MNVCSDRLCIVRSDHAAMEREVEGLGIIRIDYTVRYRKKGEFLFGFYENERLFRSGAEDVPNRSVFSSSAAQDAIYCFSEKGPDGV